MPQDDVLPEIIPITVKQSGRFASDVYVGELRTAIVYSLSSGFFQWEAISDVPTDNFRSSNHYQTFAEAVNSCLRWMGYIPYNDPEANA
jgi:hypothetical protein